ncbi:MAG: chemotaxis protein CheR [Verrucomicrobia bacterium]|nr:MAG: chemotaxis protein CheR [Verrucomicrobiota bacterium]
MNTPETEACRYISELVHARSGIKLNKDKETLIKARLGKRIRLHGFATLPEYCRFLRVRAGEEELTQVVDALTTNFTNFLREADHFQFLAAEGLPQLLARGERTIRIWSAACSSGEEAYSMGFYLSEFFPRASGWLWQLTASDISTSALDKARLGVYSDARVTGLRADWLRKYFQRGTGHWTGHYRIKRSVADHIQFRKLNLMEEYAHPHPFHAILCRNVMIYFDRPTQERVVTRLCRALVQGGYLIVGHSESLNGLNVPVRCLRPSIYQK